MKPYRPSNAFEGADFQEKFCVRCGRDVNDDCPILTASYFEQVTEWVEDADGPRCTVFVRRVEG